MKNMKFKTYEKVSLISLFIVGCIGFFMPMNVAVVTGIAVNWGGMLVVLKIKLLVMDRDKKYTQVKSFYKVVDCINSCNTHEQLLSCHNMIVNYSHIYRAPVSELCMLLRLASSQSTKLLINA